MYRVRAFIILKINYQERENTFFRIMFQQESVNFWMEEDYLSLTLLLVVLSVFFNLFSPWPRQLPFPFIIWTLRCS